MSYFKERLQVLIPAGLAAIFLERMMDVIFFGVLTVICIGIFIGGSPSSPLIILALVLISLLALMRRNESGLRRLAAQIPWGACAWLWRSLCNM